MLTNNLRCLLARRGDGVIAYRPRLKTHSETGLVKDHPVRSIIRRLRGIFIDVASTPPLEEGNINH